MAGSERAIEAPPLDHLLVRPAELDDELEAAAWLRAMSFYVYPPERKFAGEVRGGGSGFGMRRQPRRTLRLSACATTNVACSVTQPADPTQIHQLMVQEEEFKLLKAARLARRLAEQQQAACTSPGSSGGGTGSSGGANSLKPTCERSVCLVALSTDPAVLAASDARLVLDGDRGAVVGTLDLHAVRAMDGQVHLRVAWCSSFPAAIDQARG